MQRLLACRISFFYPQICGMNVCFNGAFFPATTPLLPVQNAAYKWGDGVFETMKVFNGRLLLQELHFERLFSSLRILQVQTGTAFTPTRLVDQVLVLCRQNNCLALARVRIAVFRQDDATAGYSIEALPLAETANTWPEQGVELTLFPYARKSMDAYSNLKSANFLPYVLAQQYAQENGADEALVLNAQNFLCDASKANLFLVKGKVLYTPALHQGCVNGVMRRVVSQQIKTLGYRLHTGEVEEAQLLAADEVFLTNAVYPIRWVQRYKNVQYGCQHTRLLFDAVAAVLFQNA